MVMKAAGQLSLFQVSGNMLVGHLLETGLEEVNFLKYVISICEILRLDELHTSSSLHARPPPVDAGFLFF